MLKTVLRSELKNMTRDPMYIFFAIFPVILGVIGYFLIPYIADQVPVGNPTPQIVAMFLILMTGYIFGAITGFTLLDDKDDNVLMSLKITPINVKTYVIVKLIVSYLFGFIATLIITLATDFLPDTGFGNILLISAIGAMQGPGVALIVNSFAENKVSGFVIMKMSGLLLIVPVLTFFIFEWQEVFLIFAPGFWPGRMIQMELLPQMDTNFTFMVYFFIGVIYNLVFLTLLMKLYARRSNI